MEAEPFFDPRDLVQVKYELLRRVRVEGDAVSHATALFSLSRPTFYTAQAAWERSGLVGLLPDPTGSRHGHKLTEEILEPVYEEARTWAVHPISHPPPGWAHMVRRGMASWMRECVNA